MGLSDAIDERLYVETIGQNGSEDAFVRARQRAQDWNVLSEDKGCDDRRTSIDIQVGDDGDAQYGRGYRTIGQERIGRR